MNKQVKNLKGLRYLDDLNSSDTAIVLFHGYGAGMADLYGISNYAGLDVDWYFPDGPVSIPMGYMMEGRAWFPIDMAELERAMSTGSHRRFDDKRHDEFDRSQALALEFLRELRGKYKKLIVGGFSQGAMLASHVFSDANADGLVLFSGTLIDKNKLLEKLEKSRSKIGFLQSHGKGDPLLEFAQARDLFSVLEESGLKGEFVEFSGGHEIPENVLRKFASFVEGIKRP